MHNGYIYYKSLEAMGKKYNIKDSLVDYKWIISKDSKLINGLKCTLAFGTMENGTKIEACYSKEIPLKDGPDKFWGLPGLIIQTKFSMNGATMTYVLQEIKYSNEDISLPNSLDSKKTFTFKEFLSSLKEQQQKQNEINSKGVDKD
ncbi:GLPGLI family protein [Empedobacter sp.]|uniref:GLPGLI family protein n=1 Tax=Empedobacter sp. TaxID=1927715 RepID=UPI0028A77E85|nr:GLPGLI family protein [Empedobacter sp.]